MSVEDRWHHKGTRKRTADYGRGKRWRVRNKGARTMSFHKKSDAQAHDVKVNNDLLKGLVPFDPTAGRVLVSEAVPKWLKERYSDVQTRRTVASRFKNHILPTFGHLRVCDITLSRVIEWWAEMCEKTKPNGERYATSTLELVYVHFGSFLRTAVKGATKLLPVHPFDGWDVEVPRRDRRVRNIWEQERVNTVLAAMPERERPIGLVSATCGHRQGEAFAVALEDVNRFRKEITIRHQVKRVGGKLVLAKPKGGKVRTVPLADVTATAIAQHAEKHGTTVVRCTCCNKDWHVVFTNDKGGLIDRAAWNPDVWHPAIQAAELAKGGAHGMHNLRHYYASRLIEGGPGHRGASMEQVRDYMGHASIVTTSETYGHLFEQAHERARSLMDDLFSAVVYPLRTAEGR
ncbi:tyrosine-type recombinase/integrase [Amycolatopsis sp. WAC 04182]|uniref:tyrosine-type recombinase/integrase n=1 Tax=Amycolatopsis sp. WAC 04182 TaxID=2203198 RepID=UPI0013154266|nr:tyrosine-type recombinase/integrase [Amycolatopsis sp. WAC 04182]